MARDFLFRTEVLTAICISVLISLPVRAQVSNNSQAPVKVFILAGQSNMEGKAKVSLLKYQMMQPDTAPLFSHLHEMGELIERDDVFIKFLDRNGKLTAGYGSKDRIGPELQFGFTVGDHFDEPVLLIKTAWGGKSLYRDFRPPIAGKPDASVLEMQLRNARKSKPETTMADIKATYSYFYKEMIMEVETTLKSIDKYVPGYDGQGYEIEGFAWFQGWNDMVNADYVPAYTELMAQFIRNVRRDLKQPDLPFVIGVLGVGGVNEEKPNERKDQFKKNQAAVGDLPEFKDSVAIVQTDEYWDMEADAVYRKGWKENLEAWEKVGSDRPYHYLGSVKCYNRIGGALAESLLNLTGHAKASDASIGDHAAGVPKNFRQENLVAWCIVPFDAKNRNPEERASMVRRLGLNRVAYDWREKHIPEFEREILAYKRNGLEYFAFWGWHESMESLIEKHGVRPQIWEMFHGQLPGENDDENVKIVATQFFPLAEKAKSLGLKFGIYNHGGWAGKPENLIAVCDYLRDKHKLENVGIVYNFHHGHADIADFKTTILQLKPYLLCLNLNGMADPTTVDHRTLENKILPIGSGMHEAMMIDAVIASGYEGPIGILGHRADVDAETSVGLNVQGLSKLLNGR